MLVPLLLNLEQQIPVSIDTIGVDGGVAAAFQRRQYYVEFGDQVFIVGSEAEARQLLASLPDPEPVQVKVAAPTAPTPKPLPMATAAELSPLAIPTYTGTDMSGLNSAVAALVKQQMEMQEAFSLQRQRDDEEAISLLLM